MNSKMEDNLDSWTTGIISLRGQVSKLVLWRSRVQISAQSKFSVIGSRCTFLFLPLFWRPNFVFFSTLMLPNPASSDFSVHFNAKITLLLACSVPFSAKIQLLFRRQNSATKQTILTRSIRDTILIIISTLRLQGFLRARCRGHIHRGDQIITRAGIERGGTRVLVVIGTA